MKPKQLICQACKHDHAQNERTRCDRSDLEIAYDALLDDAIKMREACEPFTKRKHWRPRSIGANIVNAIAEFDKKWRK